MQNVNLTLSNEYLRILIDVQMDNYVVASRCYCDQPLRCLQKPNLGVSQSFVTLFPMLTLEMLSEARGQVKIAVPTDAGLPPNQGQRVIK